MSRPRGEYPVDGDDATPLKVALSYAERGWLVFPLWEPLSDGTCSCDKPDCEDAGKHPRTPNGFKDATTDEETIRGWWGKWPDANIGIRTGRESGLLVLDVDPRHGGDKSLAELEQDFGKLPHTTGSKTGDGHHVFFAYPKDAVEVGCHANLRPGLDVRGDGGFVVAPPSLHHSGATYAWDASLHPDQTALADPPARLLDLIQSRKSDSECSNYERHGWDGTVPGSVEDLLSTDEKVLARFDRDDRSGLKDQTESGVDFGLASLLAHGGLPGFEIEAAVRASRDKAGLPEKPTSYYITTVGKALATSNRDDQHPDDARVVEHDDGQELLGASPLDFAQALRPGQTSVGRFFQRRPRKRVWLVDGLLPARVAGLLVAAGGVGKSHQALHLGIRIALGRNFGPFDVPRPRGVLILSREDDEAELHRRFMNAMSLQFPDQLAAHERKLLEQNMHVVDFVGDPKALLSDQFIGQVGRLAAEIPDVGLIVLDPLGKMVPDGVDINSQAGAGFVHSKMDTLVKDTGATVLATHHITKLAQSMGILDANAATGSKQLVDYARVVLSMKALSTNDAKNLNLGEGQFVQLELTKANYSPTLGQPCVFERGEGGALAYAPPVER